MVIDQQPPSNSENLPILPTQPLPTNPAIACCGRATGFA